MPVFGGTTVFSGIAWLGLTLADVGSLGFTLVVVATLASIASMAFALFGCLPIDKQLMT